MNLAAAFCFRVNQPGRIVFSAASSLVAGAVEVPQHPLGRVLLGLRLAGAGLARENVRHPQVGELHRGLRARMAWHFGASVLEDRSFLGRRLKVKPKGQPCVFPQQLKAFGVSAQVGSGVVRGGPGPGFHQVLRGLRGGPGWFEASAARAAGWSGAGWFEIRFHQGVV